MLPAILIKILINYAADFNIGIPVHASIENIIESTFAMFAFHSSRGQLKLPIIPWNVNKMASKMAC